MRKVEIEDLYSFRFVSAPAWSPDGKRAVFALSQANKESNGYDSDLWLWDGSGCRKLTSSRDVKSALWLDEDRLLFASARDRKTGPAAFAAKKDKSPSTSFYSLDLRGGEAQKYMELPFAVLDIKKMSGESFAFSAIYDMAEKRDGAYEIFEEIPFWFDGKGYTDRLRVRLYTLAAAGAEPAAVTAEDEQLKGFAVDGGRIVYVSQRYGRRASQYDSVTLLEGGEKKTLVPPETMLVSWTAFLNGEPVAAMTDGKKYGSGEIPGVWKLSPDGFVRLFEKDEVPGGGIAGDSSFGAASKTAFDGEAFYYATVSNMSPVLRKFEDGKLSTLFEADGSIDAISVKNGRVLASCIAEDRLPELYEIKDGKALRLTGFNDELCGELQISRPEPLSVTSDGWEINGAVIKPAGFEEGKSYPAVLEIHGGPFGAYGLAYYHEMQVLASRGYFVFYCNPRGGDGRGSEFAELRGKLGTIDYDDIMAFTDKVLESYPMIDRARLGVTGGSYGGYMTNWIIGHTDRFAAAVSCRSISNWLAQNLYTDIGLGYGEEIVQGDVWNGPEGVWEQSPLKYADRAKTPTIFIHSDRDFRCYMGEGLQMYTALQKFGVDTRFCLFHGESHGLSRGGKPRNRVTRLSELAGWMDKYLKG